jgi:phage-related protein
MSKSTCHRATQKAKIHAYRVTAVHELKEPDREKRMAYCRWLQAFLNEHPGILDFVWFTDEAWFHM